MRKWAALSVTRNPAAAVVRAGDLYQVRNMNMVRAIQNVLTVASVLIGSAAASGRASAQEGGKAAPAEQVCTVDLQRAGMMKDVVSNVLLLGVQRPEAEVREFLKDAEKRYATGQELMGAAAKHFKIDEATMGADVERFRHVNCTHGPNFELKVRAEGGGEREAAVELSAFARDVAMHVVLHELGHALVREFDLPILSNEEAMADAFATHYLTVYMPDRALDVLTARTTSLMIEAREVPRDQWPVSGEHESDARRAFQIAALAIAADPQKYAALAGAVGMTENDVRKATDYGAEVHRSWRRVLAPLMMPAGQRSKEGRVIVEEGSIAAGHGAELAAALEPIVTGIDWHSRVSIRFVAGEGGAAWSRGQRTITVNSQYLRRFVDQGRIAERNGTPAR
jgi:hypothetical protein